MPVDDPKNASAQQSEHLNVKKDIRKWAGMLDPFIADASFITTTYTAKGVTKIFQICHEKTTADHRNNELHKSRVDEIRTFQDSACLLHGVNKLTADLMPTIEALGSSDKDKVCAKLFWCMLSDPSTANEKLEEVHAMVAKLQYKEFITLLKLAVWKSVCIMDAPKNEMMCEALSHWYRTGWKANKSQLRRSSAISVIVFSVLPFLGKRIQPKQVV